MYVLAAMLVAGFVCNYLVKPLADNWFMKPEEVAALQAKQGAAGTMTSGSFGIGRGGFDSKAALFWAFVGIPLAWGVWQTLVNAMKISDQQRCPIDPAAPSPGFAGAHPGLQFTA